MQRIALGFSWVLVVPHPGPVAPNALTLLCTDDCSFDLGFLAVQLVAYELFTRVVPLYRFDVGN
jgi:hypothetical protein